MKVTDIKDNFTDNSDVSVDISSDPSDSSDRLSLVRFGFTRLTYVWLSIVNILNKQLLFSL